MRLFFNLRDGQLSDLEFRQKLVQVLPVRILTSNCGIPVEGPISRSIYTDKSVNFYLYDEDFIPEYVGKTLNFIIPDTRKHKAMANEIEEYWEKQLGIKRYSDSQRSRRNTGDYR